MSVISSMRKQDAIYWARLKVDDFGTPVYAPPVQIKCRWEDSHEMFKDAVGEDQLSNSKVYVDRDCPEGGVLWLGTMDTLVSQTKPFDNPKAYEIRKFNSLPNLRATEFLKTCWL